MQKEGAAWVVPSSTALCVGLMAPLTPTSASWTSTTAGYGTEEVEASTSSRMACVVVSAISLMVMYCTLVTDSPWPVLDGKRWPVASEFGFVALVT